MRTLACMATNRRGTPPDRLIFTALWSIAQRHGGWTAPEGDARAEALEELRAAAHDRTDLAIEAAGVMLGAHPEGDASHDAYVSAAGLLLELAGVTAEHETVREWVAVGAERRARRRGPEPDRGW